MLSVRVTVFYSRYRNRETRKVHRAAKKRTRSKDKRLRDPEPFKWSLRHPDLSGPFKPFKWSMRHPDLSGLFKPFKQTKTTYT
jgi:hypothetical protein